MPERPLREALRLGATFAAFGLVAWLSHLPLGRPSEVAILRLALWDSHAGWTESCRERTPEELAGLPIHMASPEVCETTPVPYRLRVALDGRELLNRRVEPSGLWGDRPLVVDEQLELAPGRPRLEVELRPEDDGPANAATPHFALDREIPLESDRITLVILDGTPPTLQVREPPGREAGS